MFNLEQVLSLSGSQQKMNKMFTAIFFRKCTLDASVYMVATEERLQSHRMQAAHERGWDWLLDLEAEEDPGTDATAIKQLRSELLGDSLTFMPDGARGRIAGYQEIARPRGLLPKKVALVNLSQTPRMIAKEGDGQRRTTRSLRSTITSHVSKIFGTLHKKS